ncbi:MAG: hypothetical protein HQL74_11280 [Magnetococcales bacterium]|nr:hypothetical protein [Magnetococcales bacterium]
MFSFALAVVLTPPVVVREIMRFLMEKGRWSFFGYYCLGAALFVLILYKSGY